MAEYPEGQELRSELSGGRLAAAGMTVGATLLALVTAIWCIAEFWRLSQAEAPGPTLADFAATVVWLLGGWGLSLLLWGGAEALRKLDNLAAVAMEAGASATVSPGPVPRGRITDSATLETHSRLLRQLVDYARETRDIALLSEHERNLRARTESMALKRQLEEEVPKLLREHSWREARQRVDHARSRFPSVSAWDELADQVEQARARFEAHDIENAKREIEDLAALNAWDRAQVVVRELQRRHPDSQPAAELAQYVARRRDEAANEERARLMSRAQEATDAREWREALRWVEELVEKYPNAPETNDLRQQLPTVRKNAEIQARQQMEVEIRDLIKAHRFGEALQQARQLITNYPQSPQATVLREQLPRLMQRARDAGQII